MKCILCKQCNIYVDQLKDRYNLKFVLLLIMREHHTIVNSRALGIMTPADCICSMWLQRLKETFNFFGLRTSDFNSVLKKFSGHQLHL